MRELLVVGGVLAAVWLKLTCVIGEELRIDTIRLASLNSVEQDLLEEKKEDHQQVDAPE